MISLANPYILGALAAGQLVLLSGAYLKGREHERDKCAAERAEALQDALDEIERDRQDQAGNAAEDRSLLISENARLNRLLRERSANDVQDGRTCIVPNDALGLRDDYDAIFEKRLQAGRELDGAE